MRKASDHQSEKKKSEQEHVRPISSIKRVTRKFLEVLRCSRAKQRQINVQTEKGVRTCKVAFY